MDTPDEVRYDFTKFHPLDHAVGSLRCYGFYGGPWRHARVWWWVGRWRSRLDPLLRPVHRWWWCRRGRHDMQVWLSPGKVKVFCQYCSHTRLPSEVEWDEHRRIFGDRPR